MKLRSNSVYAWSLLPRRTVTEFFEMKMFYIDFNHELVKADKLKAISRFIMWQVKSRILRRNFVHNWVEESKFYVKNGETGLTQNIYVGLAEFEDMSFLLHLLQEDDYFIDVGSNSGSYSILGGAVTGARTSYLVFNRQLIIFL